MSKQPVDDDPEALKAVQAMASRITRAVERIGTHQDAADAAGVGVRQLRRWMAGEGGSPSVLTLARLAAAAGCTVDWFVNGGPEPNWAPREAEPTALARMADATLGVEGKLPARIALEVLRLLDDAGLFEAYAKAGNDLEEEDEQVLQAIVREVGLSFMTADRSTWPTLAAVSVASQRAALTALGRRSEH